MRLKIDPFSWAVIGVVVVLLVAAVVTVNLTAAGDADLRATVAPESPAAPVVGAILALQEGDVAAARDYYTAEALEQYREQGYDPLANAAANAGNDLSSRRIRILSVSQPQTGERGTPIAYVTLAEDTFSGGGLFNSSTWSSQRVVRVAQEEGVWKVDDVNLIY